MRSFLRAGVVLCVLGLRCWSEAPPASRPDETSSLKIMTPTQGGLLDRLFRDGRTTDELSKLGSNPTSEQLAQTMSPAQKEAARQRLKILEETATDDVLPEIQRGYQLLGFPTDGLRVDLMRKGQLPRSSGELTRQAAQAAAEGRKADAMRLAAEALARNPEDEQAYKILKLVPPKDIGGHVNPQDPFSQDSSVVKPDVSAGETEPSRSPNQQAQALMRQAIQVRRARDVDGTFKLALDAMRADPTSNTVQQFYGLVLQDREKQMRRLSTTLNFVNQAVDAANAGHKDQALAFANQALASDPNPVTRQFVEELRARSTQAQAASQRSPQAPTSKNMPPGVPIGGGALLFAIGAWVAKKDRDAEKALWEDPKRTAGLAIMGVGAFGLAAGIGIALEGVGLLSGLGGAAAVNGAGVTAGASVAAGGAATTAVGAKLVQDGLSYSKSDRNQEQSNQQKPTGQEGREVGRIKNPSKSESPFWKQLKNYRDGIKRSGSGAKMRYYKWDNLHNDIEMYDSKGEHLGTVDPMTGVQYKPAAGHSITSEL